MRRAFSLGNTSQLPQWKETSGLTTPFGQFMREAHERRSQSSSQNHAAAQSIPEESQLYQNPQSPARRGPRKSASEVHSPRSSSSKPGPTPQQSASRWVSMCPAFTFDAGICVLIANLMDTAHALHRILQWLMCMTLRVLKSALARSQQGFTIWSM